LTCKLAPSAAFELVARASQLRFDQSAFGAKTDTTKPVDETASVKHATELAGGLNWYFKPLCAISLQLHRTSYLGGAPPAETDRRKTCSSAERSSNY